MKPCRNRTPWVDAQSGIDENRWFLVVAELDDELLTFENFETMAENDPRRNRAQRGNPHRNPGGTLSG